MVALFSFVFTSTFCLLAAPSASANPAPAPAPATPSTFFEGLLPPVHQLSTRQTTINQTSIPAECQSQCAGLNKFASCTDAKCACSDANSDALALCLNCAVSLDNTQTNLNTAQGLIDRYVAGCKQAEITVKSQKLSGNKNGDIGLRPALLGVASVAMGLLTILL